MRKVLISKVQPGVKLGKTVYSPDGRVLLAAGAELNSEYLKRLHTLGFSSVLVKDNYCNDLVFPEIVSERAKIDGTVAIKNVFEEAGKSKKLDTGTIKSLVNQLVDEVVQSRKNLLEIADVRTKEGYLFAHSLNVCIIALRMGLQLNYNELQLRDLGVGAILHDIGLMFVDKRVLYKTKKLTTSEFELFKQHTNDGFNLLREQNDINLLSAHVAFQHHERFDGGGYPRLLKKTEICEYARIVAVADVFDALTSESNHRKARPVAKSLEIINKESGRQIDQDLVGLLAENIAIYSTGALVELNSGEVAVVTANNPGPYRLKPKVKILLDDGKRPVETVTEIDLQNDPDVSIVKVIEDEAFCTKVSKIFGQG